MAGRRLLCTRRAGRLWSLNETSSVSSASARLQMGAIRRFQNSSTDKIEAHTSPGNKAQPHKNFQPFPYISGIDPYSYTRGRWLDRDRDHREARQVNFDFPALCQKAVDACDGATRVVSYNKKEGGFNRTFILHLDNGVRVAAKVPYHLAGPRRLTTNSEVATMHYVRSCTKIPVPTVLDWSDDANYIGSEYIIMEHVQGIQLHKKWDEMTPHQHMLCVKKLTFMITEMAKLKFPMYGSLYFSDASIDPSLKTDFVEGICIGPHCGAQFWNCDPLEPRYYDKRPPNRGPWPDLQSYFSGLIDTGYSHIPGVDKSTNVPPYRGTVDEHLQLMGVVRSVIQELIQSQPVEKASGPMLLHPDLNIRNIFVSEENPTCITAIIDWQSTSIEPTLTYATYTPDWIEDAAADMPILKKLMSTDDETDDVPARESILAETAEETAARIRYEKDVVTCQQTFEVILRGYMRRLHDARALDQTLLRPLRYCDSSWKYSAAGLRQDLIELSHRWAELGLHGACPYQPTPEELAVHNEQYEDFEMAQKLRLVVKHALDADSDGWVPADKWVTAREENTRLFEQWLDSVKQSGGSEDRARALWPFDEIGALSRV